MLPKWLGRLMWSKTPAVQGALLGQSTFWGLPPRMGVPFQEWGSPQNGGSLLGLGLPPRTGPPSQDGGSLPDGGTLLGAAQEQEEPR